MIYRLLATFEVKANSMSIEEFKVNEITLTKVFKVYAETTEKAFEYVKKQISCFCKRNNKTILKNHIILLQNIMSYHNGHNSVLVDKLNELWDEEINRFNISLIVESLYTMYSDECYDKNICRLPFSDPHYGDFLWEFLTNVCDDLDLQTIIQFVTHKKG